METKYSFSLCGRVGHIFEVHCLKTHLLFPSFHETLSFIADNAAGGTWGHAAVWGGCRWQTLSVLLVLHAPPEPGRYRGSHARRCAGQELLCPPHFPHTAQGTCAGRPAVTALLLSSRKSSLESMVIAIQDDAALWFPVASYHVEGKGKSNILLPLCRKMWWLGWQPPGKSRDSTQKKTCRKRCCSLVSKVSSKGDKKKSYSASQLYRFCLRELMGNVTHFWV